jgi:predicted alpha-1,6-mannanase (GH76 family)
MQTSRRDFNCATWQNNIATNCPQQVKPLAWRSAECFFTARANSPRENSCKAARTRYILESRLILFSL